VAVLFILTIGKAGCFAADHLITFAIGPAWPSVLLNKQTSWNAEVLYGIIIDQKIAFGVTGNFLWNTKSVESLDTNHNYRIKKSDESYMFPLSGFIMVDPFRDLMVHPAFRLEMGYNSLQYYTTDSATSHHDYYYGLFTKIAADGIYDIGSHSSIFAGCFYQWANTRTSTKSNGTFGRRDMSGAGVAIGFRFQL